MFSDIIRMVSKSHNMHPVASFLKARAKIEKWKKDITKHDNIMLHCYNLLKITDKKILKLCPLSFRNHVDDFYKSS